MKIIQEKEKNLIVLEDGDYIVIKTLKGNPIELHVECKSGTLLVDEMNAKKIKNLKEEQKQATIMKSYLKNK